MPLENEHVRSELSQISDKFLKAIAVIKPSAKTSYFVSAWSARHGDSSSAHPCLQPQNEHIELWQKRHGKRFDHDERLFVESLRVALTLMDVRRKKTARAVHEKSAMAQKLRGIK
jgi:hypothetical protein